MNDFASGETIRFTERANFNFLVQNGQPFTIRANGYDGGVGESSIDPSQDCLDEHFGHHDFSDHVNLDLGGFPPGIRSPDACYVDLAVDKSDPDNDPFKELQATFGPHNTYGVGRQILRAHRCTAGFSVPRPAPRDPPAEFEIPFDVPCEPEQQREALQELLRELRGSRLSRVVQSADYELAVTIEEFSVDFDSDSLGDDEDACPLSDLALTVGIGATDTGVANATGTDGCTILDLISRTRDSASNRGDFLRGITRVIQGLVRRIYYGSRFPSNSARRDSIR